MIQFKSSITIILLISFFLISTCTTDNSIINSTDQSISKTEGIENIGSTNSDWELPDDPFWNATTRILIRTNIIYKNIR